MVRISFQLQNIQDTVLVLEHEVVFRWCMYIDCILHFFPTISSVDEQRIEAGGAYGKACGDGCTLKVVMMAT